MINGDAYTKDAGLDVDSVRSTASSGREETPTPENHDAGLDVDSVRSTASSGREETPTPENHIDASDLPLKYAQTSSLLSEHRQLFQTMKPVVKKNDQEYMGMFECHSDDVDPFILQLIMLKPEIATSLLPGLPAYILFMVVRYMEYIDEIPMPERLILTYESYVKEFILKKKDLDTYVLWLANTLRFADNLKQYSGDPEFNPLNTPEQQEECLQRFDEYREILCELAIAICQKILVKMKYRIQLLAANAILDHKSFGLNSSFSRRKSSSVAAPTQPDNISMDELLDTLSNFKRTLNLHGVDPQLHDHFFMEIFYSLCANSLNVLLLRKEYRKEYNCNWRKGMQIRNNLSNFEQWVREEKLSDPRVLEMLLPIVQASDLLLARKLEEDVDSVAQMCPNLTPNQIIKLLNLYTPLNTDEEKVSDKFIMKIAEKLKERHSDSGPRESKVLMDTQKSFPLNFSFNPSSVRLSDIEIPDALNLPMLRKM